MWRVPTVLIVIYKYIKYAIKIVDSFPLHLCQKLLSEECSPDPDRLQRVSLSNHYKMASAFVLFLLHHLKIPVRLLLAIVISSVYTSQHRLPGAEERVTDIGKVTASNEFYTNVH